MPTLRSIQALRGIAALMVVIYHASQWTTVNDFTPHVFEVGGAGVDLFFVISGFVLWASADVRATTPMQFLWRRLVRVGPPYWIATLATAALALAWPGVFQEVRLGADQMQAVSHLLLSLLFVPHPDPRGAPFPVLQPGWTLDYEALFYGLFAVALLARRREARWAILAALLLGVWATGELWPASYTFIANPMVMEFLAGASLAAAWRGGRLKGRLWPVVALVCGLALLIGLEVIGYRPEYWRPLLWGAPATLMVGGAAALETAGLKRPWGPLQPIGDASFSIYLWHWPALMALDRIVGLDSAPVFMAEAVALSLALGFAGRALIEKPLLGWLRQGSSAQASSNQAGLSTRTG